MLELADSVIDMAETAAVYGIEPTRSMPLRGSLFASGDWMAAFAGIPATGKQVQFLGIDLFSSPMDRWPKSG